MIILHQFQPAFGLPNASPFCMKVENYLRMASLPFETAIADMRKAPKGKAPWIVDNGKVVPDSGFIVDYLKATYGDPLDARLSPAERGIALAMTRLMDEHLYWVGIYARWVEPHNWEITRPAFFGSMPQPLRSILPKVVRRALIRQLHGHGMGRHSRDEIYELGRRDLTAIADFLGDKPFFMGSEPTSVDATAYAYLANWVMVDFDTPLKPHINSRPTLRAYCERMKARYYG
ncbi:MAG: glutathione S-transferase family protein [Gammaproteobacteria bacterium]